jgi:2-succinyl-5-enolpyruvyl-6-hydroxy-3-cyclohexene-1-carboxylate synthase
VNSPHNNNLEGLSIAFNIRYKYIQTKQEFCDAYTQAQESNNHIILEVKSDKNYNFLIHERIKQEALS